MKDSIDPVSAIAWLPVYNASGETIPAFAAMMITGLQSDDNAKPYTVDKPDTNDAVANILFNGPCEIEADSYGIGTFDLPASVRYDTGDGTPSNGDEWGVASADWKLRNARSGFLIQGVIDTSNGIATAVRSMPATELRGLTFTSDTDSTADSDPGAGLFKWDNATQSSATTIYFDDVTTDTRDVSDLFGDLAGPGSGGSGTGLGYIYLQQADDSTRWQLWKWTAITAATGYTKFTVAHIASTVSIGKPIEDGKTVYALFSGEADASVNNGGRINESTQRLGNGRKDVEALSIDGVGKLFFESTALYPSGVISLADVAGTGDVKLGFRFGGVLSFASNDEADEYTIDGSGNGLLDFTTTSGGGPEHPLNLYSSDVLGGTGFTGPGITSPAIHTSGGYHIDIAGVSTAGATGTLGPGAVSTGGIITNAGSGTFFDGDDGTF